MLAHERKHMDADNILDSPVCSPCISTDQMKGQAE